MSEFSTGCSETLTAQPKTAANDDPPSPQPSDRDRSWAWLGWAGILLAAAVWRLMGITTTEVWRDEAITLIQAKGNWFDLITRLPFAEDTPPLGFLLFKAWTTISDQEWFARLLPVLLGTAWVDIIMRTARLINPRAWWAAGLLAALSHVPIHYSQEIRAYALLALAGGLCYWAAERSIAGKSPRRWLYALAGLAAVAAHSHMAGVFVFPAVVAYLLMRVRRQWRAYACPGPLILWGVLVAPLIGFARHWSSYHQASMDGWWIPPMTSSRALEVAWQFFGMQTLTQWAGQNHGILAMWTGFAGERVVMVCSVGLLAFALTNKEVRNIAIALLLSAAAFLIALYVSGRMTIPNMLDRTVLPAWTPMVIALGLGAVGTARSRPRRAISAAAVILIAVVWALGWAWYAIEGPPRRRPTTQWFAEIRRKLGPHDLIHTSPRWFKETTVYRLRDVISADQLLDEFDSYRGKPPRHRVVLENPRNWPHRFTEKLATWRQRYGSDFSVWSIRWASSRPLTPDSPEYWIDSRFRRVEEIDDFLDWPVKATRYVPKDAPTTAGTRN